MPINWGSLLGEPDPAPRGINWSALGFDDEEELAAAKRRKLEEIKALSGSNPLIGEDLTEDIIKKKVQIQPGLRVNPDAFPVGQRQAAEIGVDESPRNWADVLANSAEAFGREAVDLPAMVVRGELAADDYLKKKADEGSFLARAVDQSLPGMALRGARSLGDVTGIAGLAERNPAAIQRATEDAIASAPIPEIGAGIAGLSRAAGMLVDPLAGGIAAASGRGLRAAAHEAMPIIGQTSKLFSKEGGMPAPIWDTLQSVPRAKAGADLDAARLTEDVDREVQKQIDTALALEPAEQRAKLDQQIKAALTGDTNPAVDAIVPYGVRANNAFDQLPTRLKEPVKAIRDRIDAGSHLITQKALGDDKAAGAFQRLVQASGDPEGVAQYFKDRTAMNAGAEAAKDVVANPAQFFGLGPAEFEEALKGLDDPALRTVFRDARDGMWRTRKFVGGMADRPEAVGALHYLNNHLESLSPLRRATAEHYIPVLTKIESKMGRYLHNSHVGFDDPKYATTLLANPQAERYQNFVQFAQKVEKMTPEDADTWAKTILQKLENRQLQQDAEQSLFPEADLGALKRRTTQPPEIAEFLGEHQDWRVRVQRSLVHQAEIASEIKQWDDLAEKASPNAFKLGPTGRGVVNDLGHKLSYPVTSGSRFIAPPGQQVFTYPEIGKAMDAATESSNGFMKFLRNTNAAMKSGLVVLNPASRPPNYTADLGMALKTGHPEALKTFIEESRGAKNVDVAKLKGRLPIQDDREMRVFRSEMAKRGVITSGGAMQENRAHLGSLLGDPATGVRGYLSPGYEKMLGVETPYTKARDAVLGGMGKRLDIESAKFGSPDQGIRTNHAKYRAMDLAKAYPGWTTAQVLDEAGKRALNEIPTPEYSPKIIQNIRKGAPLAPFVTFPAEMARTGYNSFEYAAKDLRKALFSTDEQLAAEGASRAGLYELGTRGLVGAISNIALPATAIVGAKYALNQLHPDLNDPAKMEAQRRFMPDYYQNNNFTALGKIGGNTIFMDWTPLDAYGNMQQAALAAMGAIREDEGVFNAALAAFKELSSPLTDPQPVAGAAVSLATGRDRAGEGAPLTNPEKDSSDQIIDIGAGIGRQVRPGFLRSGSKIWDSMQTGDSWLAAREIASWFGVRMYRFNEDEQIVSKARDEAGRYNDVKNLRTSAVKKNFLTAGSQSVLEAESEAQQKWATEVTPEIAKDIEAARALGKSDSEIVRLFSTEGGLAKKHVLALLRGEVLPLSWAQ